MQPLSCFLKPVSRFCAVFGSLQPHLGGGFPGHFWKPEAVFFLPVTREASNLTMETTPGAVFGSLEPFLELFPTAI